MYHVEILVNRDSDFNADFSFYDYEDAKNFVAIVIEQGFEAKVWFEVIKDEAE